MRVIPVLSRGSPGGEVLRKHSCRPASLLLAVAFCLLWQAWAAGDQRPFGRLPQALQLRIELSAPRLDFLQAGRPGLLEAQQQVELRVTSLSVPWSVAARAAPLVEQSGTGVIGPERIFVRTSATQAQPDLGAGAGFVPLGDPVIVATGAVPAFSTPLELRLLTFWQDTPGTYSGDIQFTAVASP